MKDGDAEFKKTHKSGKVIGKPEGESHLICTPLQPDEAPVKIKRKRVNKKK